MLKIPVLAANRMPWADWLDLWRTHARLPGFDGKVRRAYGIAYEGKRDLMYGSLSGGKDSVALAGLLTEARIEVPWCHAHSWLSLPDTLSTVDAVADHLDLRLDVVEPADDPRNYLLHLPPDAGVMAAGVMADLCNRYSAGELLTQYTYERGYAGRYDGRRADENRKTRGRLFRSRGPVWQSTVDGKWSASPLAWWSARDTFAFLVDRGLPIHPFYRRAAELGFDPERSRVDWLFGPWLDPPIREDDTPRAVVWVYPDKWAEVVRIRPEILNIF